MLNQENMSLLKDINNSPIIEVKAIECCDLAGKESRIAVLNKFNELQENEER